MYTREEVQKIRDNLRQIKEYCLSHYVPRLRQYERVTVKFGKAGNPFRYDMAEHTFGIGKDGSICYTCGGLALTFNEDDANTSNSVFKNCIYAEDLLLDWQQVKRKIERELESKEAKRASIENFTV